MPTIAKTHAPSAGLFAILLVTAALCGPNPAALAVEKAPAAGPPLAVSKALILTPKGGRNPTVAVDRRSGAVYLAWAQEVLGPAAKEGKKADPVLQVLVARSNHGGLHFAASGGECAQGPCSLLHRETPTHRQDTPGSLPWRGIDRDRGVAAGVLTCDPRVYPRYPPCSGTAVSACT